MTSECSVWVGAVIATAFMAVTGGPLLVALGWAVFWTGEGFVEALGAIPHGWRAAHAALALWLGATLVAPGGLWAMAHFFRSALDAERNVVGHSG